jgi:signal transduction histidine kinase
VTSFDASDRELAAGTPGADLAADTPRSPLEQVRDALAPTTEPELIIELADAYARALYLSATPHDAATGAELAAFAYGSDALVALAAEGELTSEDVQATATALTAALGIDLVAVRYRLLSTAVQNPRLLELPPVAAAAIQLRLLIDLGIVHEISLWRRAVTGDAECVVFLGTGAEPSRRMRAEARAVLRRRRSLRIVGRATLRSAPILRFGQVMGAVVATGLDDSRDRVAPFLTLATQALGPVLERELLLERSRSRERALVALGERKLMRLAFDLHDGPIQDVLALAAEVSHFKKQVYPFLLESHRDLAYGRFDDITARLGELDRVLREMAHSLESKSIVSRPLGEILHREVDTFKERTGIDAALEVRGDPESLNSAQRVAIFRAIQEALTNVKEHSGATVVEVRLRARRSSIDVRITDNGVGFEVGHALARAAKRGRLGVVGIGERVRMLGGTFDLDSQPGGPTVLTFTLPRWQHEEP